MRSPARVLVVGAGSISREYALNHFTPPSTGSVVAGIVDSDALRAQDLAAEVGSAQAGVRIEGDGGNKYRSRAVGRAGTAVPSYRSLEDALSSDDEIDVVYIGAPPGSHRPLAELALRSGRHVLLEKPLAATPADADAIVSAADEAREERGAVLGMNIGMRYNAALGEMRRRILEDDELGLGKEAGAGLRGELRLHFRRWPREWQAQPWCAGRSEGGPCREVGTHFFAALLEFAGAGSSDSEDRSCGNLTARVKAAVSYPPDGDSSAGDGNDLCEVSAAGIIELTGGTLPPHGLTVDFSVLTGEPLAGDVYELTIMNGKETISNGKETDAAKSFTLFDFCSLRDDRSGDILVRNADYGRKECVRALISAASSREKGTDDKVNTPTLVTARDGRNAQRILDSILGSDGDWRQVEMD